MPKKYDDHKYLIIKASPISCSVCQSTMSHEPHHFKEMRNTRCHIVLSPDFEGKTVNNRNQKRKQVAKGDTAQNNILNAILLRDCTSSMLIAIYVMDNMLYKCYVYTVVYCL